MDRSSTHLAERALGELSSRYGVRAGDVSPVGRSGSDIREFYKGGTRFILRLQPCDDRDLNLLRGEVHWISHLSANGISVSDAVPSERGEMIEEAEVGGVCFAAVVFRAAEGEAPVDFVERWDDEFYRKWGNLVGRMHEVSRSYSPPSVEIARPHWYEMSDLAVDKYVPANEPGVLRSSRRLFERLRRLPATPRSYGLIHADLHRRNFLVKDGMVTVFDFGSCQYCWFTYDVAVSLYHAVFSTPEGEDERAFGERFLSQFMQGYRGVNSSCEIWPDEIPIFLKLRRVVMYVDMVRYWDLANISPARKAFLEHHRRGIEADTPVL